MINSLKTDTIWTWSIDSVMNSAIDSVQHCVELSLQLGFP